MNKLKLIKSFAGYPVGEYELKSYNNKYLHYGSNNEMFEIHPDIVEKFKDHFEEVKERPTSWEELGEIDGYWINDGCIIKKAEKFKTMYDENTNLFKNEQQAEASIALAQITQLLDKYDIPEKSSYWYYLGGNHRGHEQFERRGLLRFDTAEKYEHFYEHHKALIDKLAPFYIF